MKTVELPRTLVNQLLAQAQMAQGKEICGLIGGRGGKPTRCYPIPNAATDPARRFRMDPRAQIQAMREMREGGETLFAIYHSHPRGPAQPSARDIAESQYPDTLYLVISLGTEGVIEMRGYEIKAGKVEEVALLIH
ncbi:MAG: M67 family peptidase [Gammaproteobacteria bacterium]|nr:MAG: M67 family peptidase [Gammaproteobacteria bacterium]